MTGRHYPRFVFHRGLAELVSTHAQGAVAIGI